jgi:hypothetical protein
MKQSFSPKARWDRNIPKTQETNDTEPSFNEKIDVLAYFKSTKIYPRAFLWKGKAYKIKKVNYSWQERAGRETLNYFSVTTGLDLYQISYNNTSYAWYLNKIL